jgi:Peptidase family M23
MHKFYPTITLLLCLISMLAGQTKSKEAYQNPLKIASSFSGGFGELRRNHFHTGLDFRTAGQTGMPVYAAESGTVARVSVSPSGYGHALYLVHADGHTTVYGHLSRFHPKIESYVETQQYLLKQFAVDLALPAGLLSFGKGELIAWSGNTGSSGGPHLHFEIRDTKTEKPQNPLFFLAGVTDKSAPRIIALYLYPLSGSSSVNKSAKKLRVETISTRSITGLKSKQQIEVDGDIGIGIQSDDDFNGTGLKCGIYSAELFLDQESRFSFKMDHLAFDQGRYVNSHIDYEELIKNKRWIHRLYLQPGNKMDIYHFSGNRGILHFSDGKLHTIKIVVADAFGNSTLFSFKLLSVKTYRQEQPVLCTKMFLYDKINDFANEEVKIQIPEGALYDQLPFEYSSTTGKGFLLSKVQQVHHSYVPVHKSYLLSIKTKPIPVRYQSKALVALIESGGKMSAVGGTWQNGWISANPRVFGDFGVVLDTIAPIIRPLGLKGKALVSPQKIAFKITDNLSGIEGYDCEIDGSWALFEYDAKTETISYAVDKKRLKTGRVHSLHVSVWDERKNKSEYKSEFSL